VARLRLLRKIGRISFGRNRGQGHNYGIMALLVNIAGFN
jgi:hypothetical protein